MSLASDIGGGEPLDRAFGRAFQKSEAFVAPMVAAGEAAGDLPGGLQRAADVIYSRLKLRDQLVTVLAYPSFVFVSAIGALVVILLYIVPSIAPLAEELGSEPPMALSLMLSASNFLSANLALIGLAIAGGVVAILVAGRAGLLSAPLDRLLLDGPVRRTVAGLVFGSFSMSLGSMVAAGAPISEALRLAIRTAPLAGARKRLEPVALAVRQGEYLSGALGEVRGFPQSIIRLAAVGEASNAVGPMLTRSGQMEEDAALRRIETIGRIAGPALIVLLGGLLGVLMGGLLSGVSQMGQSALE
ncbi:type II secretion system F family protein [Phenylobacterium sp.]|uniref:type II secretion system F family protein n=1 Tax=Phenylobacterium sp. TaxID=1871053 RepID=UPI0037C9F176